MTWLYKNNFRLNANVNEKQLVCCVHKFILLKILVFGFLVYKFIRSFGNRNVFAYF